MDEKQEKNIDVLIDELREKTHSIEDDLRLFREILSTQKSAVESLLIDHRALNTGLQNTILAFGSLKEKVEATNSALTAMSTYKDTLIEKAQTSSVERITSFRSLCDSRVEGLNFKISSVATQATTLVSDMTRTLEERLRILDLKAEGIDTDLKSTAADLADLRSSINKAILSVLVILIGWFIKYYFPTLGLI